MLQCTNCISTINTEEQYINIGMAEYCMDCAEDMRDYACMYHDKIICDDCGEEIVNEFYTMPDGTHHCSDCVAIVEYNPEDYYWENEINSLREECLCLSY